MKLTNESKFFLGIIGGTVLIIALAVILLSRPAKPLEKSALITPTTNTRGNKDAKVWLVEFSDFQCPACKIFAKAVDELASQYPDKLLVAYRYFPLDQHPYSRLTARAALLSAKQNKFWEIGTTLFDNQEKIATASSVDNARETILELVRPILPTSDAFAMDLLENQGDDVITADVSYGNTIGISATPTFFLNGLKVEAGTPDALKTKVKESLKISN